MPPVRSVAQRGLRLMAAAVLGAAAGTAALGWSAYAGGDEDVPALPTIAVLEQLAAEAGQELSPALPGDSASAASLSIEPAENTWFVESGFMKGLAPRRVVRLPAPDAAVKIAVGIRSMGVAYEDVRRDGLFGERVLTRTVFLEADVSVAELRSGEVVHRAVVIRNRKDDVPVDELPRLEEPGLTWTTGKVPPEGFFSSVLEPVITLGAIAVAVILLFTVRS